MMKYLENFINIIFFNQGFIITWYSILAIIYKAFAAALPSKDIEMAGKPMINERILFYEDCSNY